VATQWRVLLNLDLLGRLLLEELKMLLLLL
jgi:hypothetical protein